jgi:hypothetical protein
MAALPSSFKDVVELREMELQSRRKDEEGIRNICWAILDRTIRDLFTYKDRRTKRRAKYYDTAFNWLFQYDPEDIEQPMSFAYVCDILDLDHAALAEAVWNNRNRAFQELELEAKIRDREKTKRELQRRREEG